MAPQRRWTAGALAVALGMVTGCSTAQEPAARPSTAARATTSAPSTGSSAATTPATSPPAAPPPSNQGAGPPTVTLAFAGDVHFAGDAAALLTDPATSMSSLRSTLGSADFAMVNLETAITSRGAPEPKTYHFRTSPRALDALAGVGVDVVTMANNHAVDYGPQGLADTLAARADSPIPIVGVGATAAEAFAPATVDVRGVRTAVLGSTQVSDLTATKFPAGSSTAGVAVNLRMARLRAAVESAAAEHDLVVVYLHWGTDYTTCPDAAQARVARDLEAAGADIVVGSHAHRVQGAGWLGRSYVAYGLGNFVWYHNRVPDAVTGVLRLSVDVAAAKARGRATGAARRTAGPLVTAASWTPMLVGSTGAPRVQTGSTADTMLSSWRSARSCAGLDRTPTG